MGDVVDFASYLRFVAALAFVLGLILVAAHIAKKVMARAAYSSAGAQGRRLGVTEVLPIDAKHRVFLIRRDDKEHLIMTGPSGDLVIESGIQRDEQAALRGDHARRGDADVTPLREADPTGSPQTPFQRIVGLIGERRA